MKIKVDDVWWYKRVGGCFKPVICPTLRASNELGRRAVSDASYQMALGRTDGELGRINFDSTRLALGPGRIGVYESTSYLPRAGMSGSIRDCRLCENAASSVDEGRYSRLPDFGIRSDYCIWSRFAADKGEEILFWSCIKQLGSVIQSSVAWKLDLSDWCEGVLCWMRSLGNEPRAGHKDPVWWHSKHKRLWGVSFSHVRTHRGIDNCYPLWLTPAEQAAPSP